MLKKYSFFNTSTSEKYQFFNTHYFLSLKIEQKLLLSPNTQTPSPTSKVDEGVVNFGNEVIYKIWEY